MLDLSKIRDEFTHLVDAFKADVHALLNHAETQAQSDAETVAQQATEDVNTAAGDVAADTGTATPPPTSGA